MVKNKWNIIPFFLGLILYMFSFGFLISKNIIIRHPSFISNILFIIFPILLLYYFFIDIFKSYKLNRNEYIMFKKPKNNFLKYILFIFVGYIFLIFYNTIIENIFEIGDTSRYLVELLENAKLSTLATFIFIGFFAPIIEEILFRGILLKSFENIKVYEWSTK